MNEKIIPSQMAKSVLCHDNTTQLQAAMQAQRQRRESVLHIFFLIITTAILGCPLAPEYWAICRICRGIVPRTVRKKDNMSLYHFAGSK